MRRSGNQVAGLVAVLVTLASAPGARAADPAKGEAIARLWCAACHSISAGQAQAKADAPPFATIARTHSANDLRAFLANPYPRMPNMSLSREEIDDLIGFMKTQGVAPGDTPETPPAKAEPAAPKRG